MLEQVDSCSFSMVALGPFNPAAFQPSWFADQGLVGREAAAAATAEDFVLVTELAKFAFGPLDVLVQKDKLQLLTSREDAVEPMRDLFLGVLAIVDPLRATALGINVQAHIKTGSDGAWHRAGDRLSGKDFWNSIWPKHAGLLSLQLALNRDDEHSGAVNVMVQPSSVTKFGVFVNINDHFDFKEPLTGTELADFTSSVWARSQERLGYFIDKIAREASP